MARVLVVEDNRENLELMTYLLRSFGHEVHHAWDGEAGVAEAIRSEPEIIVMDLQMPRLDGYGALAALRALDGPLRRVPVIAVTAYAMVGDREKVLAAGFNGYLTKPIEPETFVPEILGYLSEDGVRG